MKNIPKFIWYKINKQSELKSFKRSKKWTFLSPSKNNEWYIQIRLIQWDKRPSKLLHSLVMETFEWPCPEWMEINHKNWNKEDNRFINLEYVTHKQNMEHSIKELWNNHFQRNNPSKKWKNHNSIRVSQYDLEWNFIKTRDSMRCIEKKLSIKHSLISRCCRLLQKKSHWFIWKYA